MKTLIFNGSPRPHGDTMSLLAPLCRSLTGEVRIVDAYRCDISPCVDCRHCWEHDGCAISDEMRSLYGEISTCDNLLIASPIYFSQLTGPLLSVLSRLQRFYCARRFLKLEPILKPKRGAVILVGGGDGSVQKPYETACTLLKHMRATDIHPPVYCHSTDRHSAAQDAQAMAGVRSIADFFNTIR